MIEIWGGNGERSCDVSWIWFSSPMVVEVELGSGVACRALVRIGVKDTNNVSHVWPFLHCI
jgi:hypothetical protein